MTDTTNNQLLPCPFCGSRRTEFVRTLDGSEILDVACSCGCTLTLSAGIDRESDAIEEWNRRVGQPSDTTNDETLSYHDLSARLDAANARISELEEAIVKIREFAEGHHHDQPVHVLLHGLTVDIPYQAERAIENQRATRVRRGPR